MRIRHVSGTSNPLNRHCPACFGPEVYALTGAGQVEIPAAPHGDGPFTKVPGYVVCVSVCSAGW